MKKAFYQNVHSHRKIAIQNDEGSFSGCGIISLTVNDMLEFYVNNKTDDNEFLAVGCSLSMNRVD